jgi:hypothetical protein
MKLEILDPDDFVGRSMPVAQMRVDGEEQQLLCNFYVQEF